jgi:hypothetical protein
MIVFLPPNNKVLIVITTIFHFQAKNQITLIDFTYHKYIKILYIKLIIKLSNKIDIFYSNIIIFCNVLSKIITF